MNWLLVCHRSEVARPGDYVRLPLPTGDIVAYNDEGSVVVIDGICPHRGARIFTGLYGNQKATCPFHGWTYRQGEMHIPNAQAYGPGAEGAQMQRAPTMWVGDWLFARRDWAAVPIHEHEITVLPPEVRGFHQFLVDLSTMFKGVHEFSDATIACEPAVAIENALEDMHIATVHKATFAPMQLHRIAQYRIQDNSMAVYEIGDNRARSGLERIIKHLKHPTGSRYFHLFLHPCVAISSTAGLTLSVQHYLPAADGSTLFLTRLYKGLMKPGAPDMTSFYDSAAEFNSKVFVEDFEICERVVGRGHALASPDEDRIRWFREASR